LPRAENQRDIIRSLAGGHLHARIAFFYGPGPKLEGGCFLMMDVFKPLPYLGGLLSRMLIKAIAVSPVIRNLKKKRATLERHTPLSWN
jgi:hypothetical protein